MDKHINIFVQILRIIRKKGIAVYLYFTAQLNIYSGEFQPKLTDAWNNNYLFSFIQCLGTMQLELIIIAFFLFFLFSTSMAAMFLESEVVDE